MRKPISIGSVITMCEFGDDLVPSEPSYMKLMILRYKHLKGRISLQLEGLYPQYFTAINYITLQRVINRFESEIRKHKESAQIKWFYSINQLLTLISIIEL